MHFYGENSQFVVYLILLFLGFTTINLKFVLICFMKEPSFGLLFDIDGVLLRGKKLIPAAKNAFLRLSDENGKLRVPTVFVTNAGNASAKTKSEQLSELLNVKVLSLAFKYLKN